MDSRTALLFSSALLVVGACASQSKQQRDKVEEARLALEREADRLAVVWEGADPAEREKMESPLERVLAESGSDPRVAELRLLLASHYLEQRRRKDSDRIIQPLLDGPEGPPRDSAQILKAEGLTLEGHGDEALDLLLPLSGKLVGEGARVRHEKALVLAAIDARRWRLTIVTMVDWLSELRVGQEEALRFIDVSLEKVPILAQKRLLLEWTNSDFEGAKKKASDAIGRLVVLRLTRVALENKDARLARDLFREGPAWLRASEYGDALSGLAALAVEEVSVQGKRVGVVLGGRGKREIRRSIEVAHGVTDALPADVSLLTEDYRELLSQALGALLGQGAAVLVTGLTPEAATEARDFAELRQVPTLLLTSPGSLGAAPEPQYSFVLGSSPESEERALRDALGGEHITDVEVLGRGDSTCMEQTEASGSFTFPWDVWQGRGLSLIVLGDEACAEELERQAQSRRSRPLIALGLEAASKSIAGTWSLRAGSYPVLDRSGSAERAALSLRSRSWFEALGSDAVRLISAALDSVPAPKGASSDPASYREKVRTALLDAKAALDTTHARGFAGKHAMDRKLEVVR